jgi:Response regulator containing CheY-like receiver, AAA-type ATPase, and DNA-binding domains
MKLICVIDDDAAHMKVMEHHLTSQGYQVKGYNSGAAFLANPIKGVIHAIVLDHYLQEEKTGLHYLKLFKKQMPKTPIIYMTSETDKALVAEITKRKAAGFIAKDMASLVRLRTILDEINEKQGSGWLKRIFKKKKPAK